MSIVSTQSRTVEPRSKNLFFWVALLIGAVMLGSYFFAALMVSRYGMLTRDFGWKAARHNGNWIVAEVEESGPAAAVLQVGDLILAVDDDDRVTGIDDGYVWAVYALKDKYTVEIRRGSEQYRVNLEAATRRDYRTLGAVVSNLAASFGFCLVGLVLGLFKPEDRITRRASLTLLAFASYTVSIAVSQMNVFLTPWERTAGVCLNIVYPIQFALGYHFYYSFPQSAPRGRVWTVLQYLLYVWAFLAFFPKLWMNLEFASAESGAIGFMVEHGWLLRLRPSYAAFELMAVLGMCAVILRNYRLVTDRDHRRRIKWIIFGSIVGIFPAILYMVLRVTKPASQNGRETTEDALHYLSFIIGNFMSVAIPISVGYAVLRHRAFDVNIVIRRGLQYLFAKQVLRLILALPLAGLLWTIIVNRSLPLNAILTGNPLLLAFIAAAGLGLRFRRQLTYWIDRRFFREAYNQEQILINLIDQIKETDSMTELSFLVSKEIDAAMHPERLYVFYRGEENRDLQLGYSSAGQSHDLRITEESELLRAMERQRTSQDFPFPTERGLPESETTLIAELGISLIVPMIGNGGRLSGLLLLGNKKSEEPYIQNDRKLLQAIAAQMAVVYENVWLKEQAAKEQKIKHEVLARFQEQQINLVKECPACGACYDRAIEVCVNDQRELTLSLPVERTIDNKYRLEQLIGHGGMGAVYEATDLRLSRRVAIKIMLGQMFGDRAALRRFEREAQASARLNHPNIVTVYDYGGIRSDGAYLVMELVRGRTLREELRRAGRLDPRTAAVWFSQLLDGVKAAHHAGVIHRDLKPENVLITQNEGDREQIKILDFGLAKVRQLDTSNPQSLTVPGMVIGTFGYMSPEQVTGEEVDEASDIFSVGVIVVEALTGQRPFRGRTAAELITAILNTTIQLPGESPDVLHLDEILQRCLAKDRRQRFSSAAALQQALIPAIERCPPFAPAAAASDATLVSEEATRGLPIG
jgi:eukaryotic-like serine/threonine-protein kinase